MTLDNGIDEGFAIYHRPVRFPADDNVAEGRTRVVLVTTLIAPVIVQRLGSSG
jgi:hypothetical protein